MKRQEAGKNGEFLSVTEVCNRLDAHAQTIIRMIHAGKFPGAIRFGRNYRIPLESYEGFVAAHQVRKGVGNEQH